MHNYGTISAYAVYGPPLVIDTPPYAGTAVGRLDDVTSDIVGIA